MEVDIIKITLEESRHQVSLAFQLHKHHFLQRLTPEQLDRSRTQPGPPNS